MAHFCGKLPIGGKKLSISVGPLPQSLTLSTWESPPPTSYTLLGSLTPILPGLQSAEVHSRQLSSYLNVKAVFILLRVQMLRVSAASRREKQA